MLEAVRTRGATLRREYETATDCERSLVNKGLKRTAQSRSERLENASETPGAASSDGHSRHSQPDAGGSGIRLPIGPLWGGAEQRREEGGGRCAESSWLGVWLWLASGAERGCGWRYRAQGEERSARGGGERVTPMGDESEDARRDRS
ncbi:hypothetical protein COCON_G00230000 [Conger conger]|uniref:Uncharacterized protein n=1 Tax=Conger conger TaxID=82655 RepID=A0A9Q1HMY9_CONCO|nr:hypothetical protein COCON_G00230000 [Conger conger]